MNYDYSTTDFNKLSDDIKSWLIKFNQIVLLPCQRELTNIPTQFSSIMEKINECKLPSLLTYLKDHPSIQLYLERVRGLLIDKNIDQLRIILGYYFVPFLLELNYLVDTQRSVPQNFVSLLKHPILPITYKIVKSSFEISNFSTLAPFTITNDKNDMYLFTYEFLKYFLNYFPNVLVNVSILISDSDIFKNLVKEKDYFSKLIQPLYSKIINKVLSISIPSDIYEISYKIINAFMTYFYPPPACQSINDQNLATTLY